MIPIFLRILRPIQREYIDMYNQLLRKVGKMLPGSKMKKTMDAGLDLYDPEVKINLK